MPNDLLDAARRDVAEPVDALQPGAVAEMEARNRIDRPVRRRRTREVRGAQAHQ